MHQVFTKHLNTKRKPMEKKAFVFWFVFFSTIIFGVTFFGVLNTKELKGRELTEKATDDISSFVAENLTECTFPFGKKTTSYYAINTIDSLSNTPQLFRFKSYSTYVFDQRDAGSRKCSVTFKYPQKWFKTKWKNIYPWWDKKEITVFLEYDDKGFSSEHLKKLYSFLPENCNPISPQNNYCEEFKKHLNIK